MLTTIEDKMEEVDTTNPIEKGNDLKENNLKEININNDQNEFSYSYEQDPSLKSIMNNFDNSILIDSFQNQCLQFDTEKIMNVNPTFFYNDEIFNQSNYEITAKELFEKLVKDRIAFMNILLIDLSIYSNFSICGAQVFPNLKQTCIKLKDVTDFIEIKKELYNACYLVFEDQWDRKDNSTIVVFDDDGKSLFAKAFTEICIEGQWGCEAFMLKDGILSFMKDYPLLCVSEDLNEDDEYDDDDDDDDYYYNEGLYRSIQDTNSLNEQYTNTIEMVDIKNNNFNNETMESNQDINTIFNSDNIVNDIAFIQTDNSLINDINLTNPSKYQDNEISMENNVIPNSNDISISVENEFLENNKSNIIDEKENSNNMNNEFEQMENKEIIDNSKDDRDLMDYQIIENETNQNKENMYINDPNNNNDNINNIMTAEGNIINKVFDNEITEDSKILTEITTINDNNNNEIEYKVTDSMACYDPRQMASVNVDTTNNKFLKNNQTKDIAKLRKFQKYLIHNVWYAMDNSNDVPLMVCPPFLYLGSLYTSQEHHLINYNIKHVIRLGTDFNINYTDPSRFNFYNFDIFDLPKEPIKELFQKANEIIEQARLKHENVLVHCHAGVSRSSTIILAYLMRYKGMSLYDAWCSTFKIRPIIRPNDGFAIALQEYEKILFNREEPTMPVVGMSNSYLFSIEYFDFVSRLEEMHKLDPSVPVFRPEITYDDLLKEVEKEQEEEICNKEFSIIVKDDNNENLNINSNKDEEKNIKEDESLKVDQDIEKSQIEDETGNEYDKNNIKKTYISNNKDHNNFKLDKANDLKTREE